MHSTARVGSALFVSARSTRNGILRIRADLPRAGSHLARRRKVFGRTRTDLPHTRTGTVRPRREPVHARRTSVHAGPRPFRVEQRPADSNGFRSHPNEYGSGVPKARRHSPEDRSYSNGSGSRPNGFRSDPAEAVRAEWTSFNTRMTSIRALPRSVLATERARRSPQERAGARRRSGRSGSGEARVRAKKRGRGKRMVRRKAFPAPLRATSSPGGRARRRWPESGRGA